MRLADTRKIQKANRVKKKVTSVDFPLVLCERFFSFIGIVQFSFYWSIQCHLHYSAMVALAHGSPSRPYNAVKRPNGWQMANM